MFRLLPYQWMSVVFRDRCYSIRRVGGSASFRCMRGAWQRVLCKIKYQLFLTFYVHSFTMAQQPPCWPMLPHYPGFMITLRQTIVVWTLYEWSARHRDCTWQHTLSQQTDIHAPPGWIRNHNPSKQAAADPRGHWDRLYVYYMLKINY